MKIERLEELTNEYLAQMKIRVMNQASNAMEEDLRTEYKYMVQEFINIEPGILAKYREEFELDSMRTEIELSSLNVVDKIYERIVTVKRGIEHDQDIKKMEKMVKEETKEENFERQVSVKNKLQYIFDQIERQMRKREFNINWDYLRIYCNKIINNHIESIEQNVFEKNESNIITKEIERYIESIEQEMKKEKSEDTTLEFKDGPVCPVITDTNKFAQVNQQIADNVIEKEEILKKECTREDYSKVLPGDIIF